MGCGIDSQIGTRVKHEGQRLTDYLRSYFTLIAKTFVAFVTTHYPATCIKASICVRLIREVHAVCQVITFRPLP